MDGWWTRKLFNTSTRFYLNSAQTTNAAGVTITDKTCLIMDEVDGMSAGDRGGVGALAALIRKTKVSFIVSIALIAYL